MTNAQKSPSTQKSSSNRSSPLLAALLSLTVWHSAQGATADTAKSKPRATAWSVSTGAHWLSGDYGLTQRTYLRAFPLTLSWRKAPWRLKASTSFVGISGPGSLSDGTTVTTTQTANERAESGLGDSSITLTWQNQRPWLRAIWVDVSAGIKIPTADEEKGLGTGATDYRLKVDLARRWGPLTGFSTLGYRIRGESDLRPLDDAPWLSLGMSYPCGRANGKQRCGFFYDHTWPAIDSNSARSELNLFWQKGWSRHWKTTLYLTAGLNKDSADAGAGMQLKYQFVRR